MAGHGGRVESSQILEHTPTMSKGEGVNPQEAAAGGRVTQQVAMKR